MPTDDISPLPPPELIHVVITREPFMEFFWLTLDNGDSEELEIEETRNWFKERGADMQVVEKALDQCWNFYRSEVRILKPKTAPPSPIPHSPKI